MKTLRLLTTLALGTAITACGNDGLLSTLTGANGGESAQTQAIEGLTDHVCGECNGPDGEALELFVDITPEAYDGGPFEFALVIGNPAGLLDANGDWANAITWSMNEVDLFGAIPFDGWKFSPNATKARVVLLALEGLPGGVYHTEASITVEGEGEIEGEPAPDHGAEDFETYEVPHEDHPDGEPGPDGEPEPDPTPGPDGGGEGEPDPTPTPNETPDNPV